MKTKFRLKSVWGTLTWWSPWDRWSAALLCDTSLLWILYIKHLFEVTALCASLSFSLWGKYKVHIYLMGIKWIVPDHTKMPGPKKKVPIKTVTCLTCYYRSCYTFNINICNPLNWVSLLHLNAPNFTSRRCHWECDCNASCLIVLIKQTFAQSPIGATGLQAPPRGPCAELLLVLLYLALGEAQWTSQWANSTFQSNRYESKVLEVKKKMFINWVHLRKVSIMFM